MPRHIHTEPKRQRFNPLRIKCNECSRWFRNRAGYTKHYRTFHAPLLAMRLPQLPVSRNRNPSSSPEVIPPPGDYLHLDVFDDRPAPDAFDHGFSDVGLPQPNSPGLPSSATTTSPKNDEPYRGDVPHSPPRSPLPFPPDFNHTNGISHPLLNGMSFPSCFVITSAYRGNLIF